jgi:hypothetical protein
MGTKGSFAGGGGNIGADLRDGIDDWLDSLPGGPGGANGASDGDGGSDSSDASPPPSQTGKPGTSGGAKPKMSPAARRVLPTAALFRTSSGAGSKARKGTAAQFPRSAAATSRTAGRGAAAAYAYRTGDAQALRELGLDYEALRSNPDVIDVVHKIVQKVCEDLPPGEIDTDEQTHVVAEIAGWIITSDPDDAIPSPEEIAVETLATVLKWAYLTTTAAELNTKDMTGTERVAFEKEIRAACEEVAAQADLSTTGATGAEFSKAIENGIEYLQHIYEAGGQ